MGYTREQFAEKLDVSVSYMAEVERGRTGISVKMLIKICDLLGLSADYILFGTNRENDTMILDKIQEILEGKNIDELELTEEEFEEVKNVITDPIVRKRAKHAVYENQRTIQAVKALISG